MFYYTHTNFDLGKKMKQTSNSPNRVRLRQQRIMTYFIEAADQIIQSEGIGAVTIRKAADLAGYTSATLYNYFDNINHLVFMAVMANLEEYNAAIPDYLAGCTNSVDRYMAVSECFSEYAYTEPEIYELLFFSQQGDKLEEYTRQYYELFPEKNVVNNSSPLSKVFNINNIYQRSRIMLEDCVKDGFITSENTDLFNEVAMMVFRCVLQDVRLGRIMKKDAVEKTMRYYRQLFSFYMTPTKL